MPTERYEKTQPVPRVEAGDVPDVTQWETRVYALFALPKVRWAMGEMGIQAEAFPMDPVFLVESAANKKIDCNIDGLLLPIEHVRPLICGGSGSFHHVSYVVCHEWIDEMGIPYTVVVFDAHDDAARLRADEQGMIHCGSWVHYAMENCSNLVRVLGLGIAFSWCFPDLHHWLSDQVYVEGKMDIYSPHGDHGFFGHSFNRETADFKRIRKDLIRTLVGAEGYHCEIRSIDEEGFDLLGRIPTKHVYISIDMDVIHRDDFAAVEWGNGEMHLEWILELIDLIAEKHVLLGADICGYPQHQNKIKLNEDEQQRNLKAYRILYDCLARHLASSNAKFRQP